MGYIIGGLILMLVIAARFYLSLRAKRGNPGGV